MLPTRNRATIFPDPSFAAFWLLFSFWKYAAFETITSTNSHNRHIKLSERNKVLMVHDSTNNNRKGSYLKYWKYDAVTLPLIQRSDHTVHVKLCVPVSRRGRRSVLSSWACHMSLETDPTTQRRPGQLKSLLTSCSKTCLQATCRYNTVHRVSIFMLQIILMLPATTFAYYESHLLVFICLFTFVHFFSSNTHVGYFGHGPSYFGPLLQRCITKEN
jgi:hypothetical protein